MGPGCLVLLCLVVLARAGDDALQNYYDHQGMLYGVIDDGFRNNFSYQVVDHLLDFYIPSSKAIRNERCLSDGRKLKAAIKMNQGWALRMLDASSKVPSGLLVGNTYNLGNYDECMNVRSKTINGSGEPFFGKFCMVKAVYYESSILNSSNLQASNVKPTVVRDFVLGLGTRWGWCVPSSCGDSDLEAHLHSLTTDMVEGVRVELPTRGCTSRAHPLPFTPADWFTMALLVAFAIAVILSTFYDMRTKNSQSRLSLLTAFSVYTNGRQLFHVASDSGELKALHAIRTFSMLWVVIGHTYDNTLDIPSVNTEALTELLENWQHAFLMNYRLAVDVFLLLSGILLCYGFLRKMEHSQSFNVFSYYLHRYIRLTPAYAAIILLTATLLGYTDDGPIWEEHPMRDKRRCIINWWTNLLYINNYVFPLQNCMAQSWYLALDMQLYVLSPLLLYPLWKWRRFGTILLGVAAAVGLVIAFSVGYIYEFYNETSEANINELEYLPTHTRFTPWVAGVALGVLLHSGRARGRSAHLGRAAVLLGWGASCLLIIGPILVNHRLNLPTYVYNRWERAFNSALNRPAFALGVAWIIFACNNGYGGFVNTFFSWKLFTILSRLTYCTFLVHYAVILWMSGSIKVPFYVSEKTMMIKAFNVTAIAFIIALVWTLVFEVPALNIEKALLKKGTSYKKSKYPIEEGNHNNTTHVEELEEIVGNDSTNNKCENV